MEGIVRDPTLALICLVSIARRCQFRALSNCFRLGNELYYVVKASALSAHVQICTMCSSPTSAATSQRASLSFSTGRLFLCTRTPRSHHLASSVHAFVQRIESYGGNRQITRTPQYNRWPPRLSLGEYWNFLLCFGKQKLFVPTGQSSIAKQEKFSFPKSTARRGVAQVSLSMRSVGTLPENRCSAQARFRRFQVELLAFQERGLWAKTATDAAAAKGE